MPALQTADKPSPNARVLFFDSRMLKKPTPTQHKLEMVTLEEFVPKDHLLRQIDAAVDFEFIREKVAAAGAEEEKAGRRAPIGDSYASCCA